MTVFWCVVIYVLVDWYWHSYWFWYLNFERLLHVIRYDFFNVIGHFFLDFLRHKFIDWNWDRMRNLDVDWNGLWHWNFDNVGHWYSYCMRNRDSNFLNNLHMNWFGFFNRLRMDVVFGLVMFNLGTEIMSLRSSIEASCSFRAARVSIAAGKACVRG